MKAEDNPPAAKVVFNRIAVLAALKSVIAISDRLEGSLDPLLVGDIVMAINDFVQPQLQSPDDLDLAVASIPTWELTNPRDIAYSLSRTVMMIRKYLMGSDELVQALRQAVGINIETMRFDGLSIEDFVSVVFGLHAYASGVYPVHRRGVTQLVIDKATFVGQTRFSPSVLESFLAKRSATFATLRAAITGGGRWTPDEAREQVASSLFGPDFLVFRECPIMDLENGNYLILDLQFLAELLSNGLYFDVFSSLPKQKRGDFNSLWGRVFELYVWDLLGHFYKPVSGILQTDVEYDDGQIDAVLDFGSYVVVIECKFFLLEHKAKFSRNKEDFERQLSLKIVENQKGKKKGIRQLADAVSAIQEQRVRGARGGRTVYPVLVVSESSLECFGINAYLHRRFQQLRGPSADSFLVKPLTVMSIQELESILPYMEAGEATWPDILEKRFDGTDRVAWISVHQALYSLLNEKSLPNRRNDFLKEEYEAIGKDMKERYGWTGETQSARSRED